MTNSNEYIVCELCGENTHAIGMHLKQAHTDMTLDQYKKAFPEAPLYSDYAKELALKKKQEKERIAQQEKQVVSTKSSKEVLSDAKAESDSVVKRPLHEVFEVDAKNTRGEPIPISCVVNTSFPELVPEVNSTYVFDVETLKNTLMALELHINPYVWGHKGTGKTELFEQICARTGRPFVRVQHTANTEESHVVGMWTVKNNQTEFELGPLALAMKNGWVYLADEYDFALPSVLSVYQAVLEGKPLMIKEADAENRVIKPHPNFRFVATGNTNGSGDETGLYQGTNLQNSANYDRFGMVIQKDYMSEKDEIEILKRKCNVIEEDAYKLVEFAKMVRDAYAGGKISDTISPRSLIDGAKIGMCKKDYRAGVTLSFINKLTRADAEVVKGLAQRVFG